MPNIKYRYNPKTFRYERARIHVKDVLWYIAGLIFMGLLLCGGMIAAHDSIVKTDREVALRAENSLLQKHKPILEAQLSELESKLQKLEGEDNVLYTRLFNSEPPKSTARQSTLTKEQVLLADASDFGSLLDVLKSKSEKLVEKSAQSNAAFGARIKISKDQIRSIQTIPSIQPVANAQVDFLVSGFGDRINPFHKGKYNHPGVDFAAPRGSDVFVTAPGRVVAINRSSVEAGYGNYIDVDHGNGFMTRYAHLDEIKVQRGQVLVKGKVIGSVGSTGGSTAPHLHYEVIRDGEPVNPVYYLLEGLTSEQHNALISRSTKQNQSMD